MINKLILPALAVLMIAPITVKAEIIPLETQGSAATTLSQNEISELVNQSIEDQLEESSAVQNISGNMIGEEEDEEDEDENVIYRYEGDDGLFKGASTPPRAFNNIPYPY